MKLITFEEITFNPLAIDVITKNPYGGCIVHFRGGSIHQFTVSQIEFGDWVAKRVKETEDGA
jgi:hypothetical protein